MRRPLILLSLLASVPLFAADRGECDAATHLVTLYQVRSIALKSYSSEYDIDNFIDHRIDDLREPLREGGFRWVRWMRPSGSNGPEVKKGHRAVGVQDRDERDTFEASGDHGFAVRIEVPEKKTAFSRNNRVYVGSVTIRYAFHGETRTLKKSIDTWMNPDTSRTFDLDTISDHVDVAIESSTDAKTVREALVEIHILQAVADDDPENPAYPAIQSLRRIRNATDSRYAIDDEIARLETAMFPQSDPMPIAQIIADLRRADQLSRSSKDADKDKGAQLFRETMRRLH